MHFMDAVNAEQRDLDAEHERQQHEQALEARYVRRRLRPSGDELAEAVNVEAWYFAQCGFRA